MIKCLSALVLAGGLSAHARAHGASSCRAEAKLLVAAGDRQVEVTEVSRERVILVRVSPSLHPRANHPPRLRSRAGDDGGPFDQLIFDHDRHLARDVVEAELERLVKDLTPGSQFTVTRGRERSPWLTVGMLANVEAFVYKLTFVDDSNARRIINQQPTADFESYPVDQVRLVLTERVRTAQAIARRALRFLLKPG